jgi:hypothetical protein
MTIEETITQAWYNLLNGNVVVDADTISVNRTNADIDEDDAYILLRKESGGDQKNKSSAFRTFTLIVEIVTKSGVIINDKKVDDIDEVIRGLVFNGRQNNLGVDGLIDVDPGTPIYLDEDDGTLKIYRKITRFLHRTNKNF